MSSSLSSQHCVPCEGGAIPLELGSIQQRQPEIPGWSIDQTSETLRLTRVWSWGDFKQAIVFVNKVADVSETEGHHPDIVIHYNKVTLTLWTHAIGGLSENDFIMAAKFNKIS